LSYIPLPEARELYNLLTQIEAKQKKVEVNAKRGQISINEYLNSINQLLSVLDRLDLPESMDAAISKIRRVSIAVNALIASYRALTVAVTMSGPVGWVTTAAVGGGMVLSAISLASLEGY